MARVALYYDHSGYIETLDRPARKRAGMPVGLMGRQVAGKEFLDAYLTYGNWRELVVLVPNEASAQSLRETCQIHPSSRDKQRRVGLFQLGEFHRRFLADPPAEVLYFPCPPDARFAWVRQKASKPAYALCGVTHTLCSQHAVEALRRLVTAPFEAYDRLICTSRAVVDMVRAVVGHYVDYLRERHGGRVECCVGLECIPLGVNVDKFRPASPAERIAQRRRLGIASDEVVVLFVGRLAHHAKAHPFPMYRALSTAADMCGQKVHLVLSGWAASAAVLEAFREAGRQFGPHVRLSIVDGTKPENRLAVWRAADLFTSLSDNIQETFGLVVIEAMACGLPVVASDWDGYRDLVVDGQTGLLVPTTMVHDATVDLTTQLLIGEINYDHFLARSNQCVAVDVAAAAEAYGRLLGDAALRQRMGAAGRKQAVERFAWSRIVGLYERLWAEQQRELVRHAAAPPGPRTPGGPAVYPAVETSFAGYPSRWLSDDDRVVAPADAASRMATVLSAPLTNYEATCRTEDPSTLTSILRNAESGCTIAELDAVFRREGVPYPAGRATLAWMLKYDLLRTATE